MSSPLSPRPLTCFLSVASDPKPEGRRPVWRKLCGQAPSTDTAEGADSGPGGRWSVSSCSAQRQLGIPAAASSQTSGQEGSPLPLCQYQCSFHFAHNLYTVSLANSLKFSFWLCYLFPARNPTHTKPDPNIYKIH